MADYPIIDAHLHTYPTPEVGLQAMGGSTISGYTGTVEDTLKAMEKDKVSNVVQADMIPVSVMREASPIKAAPTGVEAGKGSEAPLHGGEHLDLPRFLRRRP